MTGQPEAPQSPLTARELLEGADALMRRNRRAGGAPLPPPEGQTVSAVSDEETQTLSAEVDAGREAELARELPQVEIDASSETVSSLAPESFEPLPITTVAKESMESAPSDIGAVEETFAPTTDATAVGEESEKPKEPTAEPPTEDAEAWAESDFSMEGWLEEMLSPESSAQLTESASLTVSDAVASLQMAAEGFASAIDAPEIPDPPIVGETVKKQAEEQAVEALPENAQGKTGSQAEDDLLLWEFAPQSRVATLESETTAELAFMETEEVKPLGGEPLSLTPSFSEALSFLSAPEALAGSSSYTVAPPTMVFDGLGTEEKHPAAEAVPETLPESLLEETALPEEAVWLSSEEVSEASAALDAKAAINVAKALGLLIDTEKPTETPEAAENTAEIVLPEPVAGLWYLVESETEEAAEATEVAEAVKAAEVVEVVEVGEATEVVESEAAEAEDSIDGDAALFEALLLEELREDEKAEIEAWASGTKEAPFFVESEILEPVAEALAEAETVKHFGENAVVMEGKAPEITEMTVEADDAISLASEKPPEPASAPEHSVSALSKTESASPVSAAALLSERQQRNGEAKTPSMRYSAARLLAEYQHQNPQMQNVKAAPATPHSAQAAPSASAALTLSDEHDSLSTFNESSGRLAKAAQAKRVPPPPKLPVSKGLPLELTLEPLPEAGSDHSAMSMSNSGSGDNDYYPVLTDVVDENELSASGKA